MMHQMFSVGERSGLQAGQFSTCTLLLWSHAVVIAAVCGFALSCWNTHHLDGSICCSKNLIYLSAFIVPSKTCKLPIPYALMHPHTIRDAGFWTERWLHAGRSPSSLALSTYTVNEHTFQNANNSLQMFFIGLMKYSNLLIGGFLLNVIQIITIKITKDLNYFSLWALNLFHTQVSQFELNYWNKWTFPRHSNLLKCTCIYIKIHDNRRKTTSFTVLHGSGKPSYY